MGITFRMVIIALLLSMIVFGAVTGEFVETWQNGATL